MKNSPPDRKPGHHIVVITLSMEAAYIAGNWVEFNQLAHRRAEEIDNLSEPLPAEVLERVQSIDRRMLEGMAKQKKAIAEKVGRTAQFKKSYRSIG